MWIIQNIKNLFKADSVRKNSYDYWNSWNKKEINIQKEWFYVWSKTYKTTLQNIKQNILWDWIQSIEKAYNSCAELRRCISIKKQEFFWSGYTVYKNNEEKEDVKNELNEMVGWFWRFKDQVYRDYLLYWWTIIEKVRNVYWQIIKCRRINLKDVETAELDEDWLITEFIMKNHQRLKREDVYLLSNYENLDYEEIWSSPIQTINNYIILDQLIANNQIMYFNNTLKPNLFIKARNFTKESFENMSNALTDYAKWVDNQNKATFINLVDNKIIDDDWNEIDLKEDLDIVQLQENPMIDFWWLMNKLKEKVWTVYWVPVTLINSEKDSTHKNASEYYKFMLKEINKDEIKFMAILNDIIKERYWEWYEIMISKEWWYLSMEDLEYVVKAVESWLMNRYDWIKQLWLNSDYSEEEIKELKKLNNPNETAKEAETTNAEEQPIENNIEIKKEKKKINKKS